MRTETPSATLVEAVADLITHHGHPFVPDSELGALATALSWFMDRPAVQTAEDRSIDFELGAG
jgi:hypothetical protein